MRIHVSEAPVRKNIEQFLKVLQRANPQAAQILVKTWVHRQTGQFLYQTEGSAALQEDPEWKLVEVHCAYDPELGEVCFLVRDGKAEEECFDCSDLTPQAFAIMSLTMQTINETLRRLKGPSDLRTKLAAISKLQVESEEELPIGIHLLINAWHPSDRFEAEALLWDEPIGSYIFRKDNYADLLEKQLCEEHGKLLKCFTVTYSHSKKKFCDLTLIHFDSCWLIYNDDPSLCEGKKFSDLHDLLGEFADFLKYPLSK